MRTLILTLAMASIALAQANPKMRVKLPNEQWVSLFNGKDFTGWIPVGHEKWIVEDGAIHGMGVTTGYGYLMTEKDYKDFILSLRFKCDSNGNSGVFFHTKFHPGTADVSQGLQFEIDATPTHHTGGIYGDGRGWIAWPAAKNEMVLKPDDWNDYVLTVVANHYTARLNGVNVMDFTDPSPKSFDGAIALQLHAGGKSKMRFKDIYVLDLSQR